MRAIVINTSFTHRTVVLEKYLNDISTIELLKIEDEIALNEKIRNGDQAAMERFIKGNLRFVVSIAKKYQHYGMELEDLISEGNLGLIKAVQRFDATKGFKFISFAVWWIRQSIMLALSNKRRMIRLPGNQVIGITNVNNAEVELEQLLERKPTIEELSDHLNISVQKVSDYLNNAQYPYSLDREVTSDTTSTLLDILPDMETEATDQSVLDHSRKMEVRMLLGGLTPREQQIIKLFYGLCGNEPMDIECIAGELQISKERVRQLKVDILKKLQKKYACGRHDYLQYQ
jgi:RNA polymerase primary sigma factor